jgi:hypothetical protein
LAVELRKTLRTTERFAAAKGTSRRRTASKRIVFSLAAQKAGLVCRRDAGAPRENDFELLRGDLDSVGDDFKSAHGSFKSSATTFNRCEDDLKSVAISFR